jgi:hypothetical protein
LIRGSFLCFHRFTHLNFIILIDYGRDSRWVQFHEVGMEHIFSTWKLSAKVFWKGNIRQHQGRSYLRLILKDEEVRSIHAQFVENVQKYGRICNHLTYSKKLHMLAYLNCFHQCHEGSISSYTTIFTKEVYKGVAR